MGKFIERELDSGKLYLFDPEDGEPHEIALGEDNFSAHLHRTTPLVDRVSLIDDRDGLAWLWFRYDMQPQVIEYMVSVAHSVGQVVVRDTPLDIVQSTFDAKHQITDTDISQLLDYQG